MTAEQAQQCVDMYKIMNDNFSKEMSAYSKTLFDKEKEKAQIDNDLANLRTELSKAQNPAYFQRKTPATCVSWHAAGNVGPTVCRDEFGAVSTKDP